MAKNRKVQYNLSDLEGFETPSEDDIKNILRAADDYFF